MRIELRGAVKKFDKVRALDGVSVQIEPGEIVAVLGLNGAGKSTFLNAIAGVIGLDSGEILFDGERFTRDRLDLRRRFLYLPDFPFLFWDQTVVRNIGIYLRMYDAIQDDSADRVNELLERFDLLPLADSDVGHLSRGQIYKTAMTALASVWPEIWLLDEPFASGMDPNGINQFKQLARQRAAHGGTVVYSTQLLDVAERFSNRVVILHDGEVRAEGTMDELRGQSADKDNVLEDLFNRLREPA